MVNHKYHDPMDEKYWKKRIEESIKKIHRGDKLLTEKQTKDLIKKIRKI